MIYFNNAATSYPKPDAVAAAVMKSLNDPPSNPNRENVTQKSVISSCREKLAELFHFSNPNRVIFCSGSTEALNMAINGLIFHGCRVVTTQMEHNAVLRPLYYLKTAGVCQVDILPCGLPGKIDADVFKNALKDDTGLAVVNHVSNVTGARLCIPEIYEICESRQIPLIIDVSQSAGAVDLDFSSMPRAIIAFTGHKTLLGPKGVGGLLVGEDVDLHVWKSGGTGIGSDRESMPDDWPIKFEAGTMNQPGISGLEASVGYILENKLSSCKKIKMALVRHLVQELEKNHGPAISIYSERPEKNDCGIVCFNVNGWNCEEIGYILNMSFDIRVRAGLHCAPLIHKAMGTFPHGAVRVSFSCFNTHDEIETFVKALKIITG